MSERFQKARPYIIYGMSLICALLSTKFLSLCPESCSSHEAVDQIEYDGKTWLLNKCPVPSQAADGSPSAFFQYHLETENQEQRLILVESTPRFFGNQSKLQFDLLRTKASHQVRLGTHLQATSFVRPGPRNLEVDPETHLLRVVFGDGKYSAFATEGVDK